MKVSQIIVSHKFTGPINHCNSRYIKPHFMIKIALFADHFTKSGRMSTGQIDGYCVCNHQHVGKDGRIDIWRANIHQWCCLQWQIHVCGCIHLLDDESFAHETRKNKHPFFSSRTNLVRSAEADCWMDFRYSVVVFEDKIKNSFRFSYIWKYKRVDATSQAIRWNVDRWSMHSVCKLVPHEGALRMCPMHLMFIHNFAHVVES